MSLWEWFIFLVVGLAVFFICLWPLVHVNRLGFYRHLQALY